jgi:tetratricopeptide (TPR) repeat protein
MRTKEVVLLWVVLAPGLLPCIAQSAASPQQQVESHKRRAQEYLKQQRPDLAIPEFRAILVLDPKNVDARGNLGVLLFFQGEYGKAIPELRAALKLQPSLGKIEALMGIAEKRTGDIKAARRDLEEAFPKVRDEKIRIETGMELIDIYSATGDLDKAGSTVSVLQKLEPTNQTILYSAYRIHSDLADESLLNLSVVAPNSARMHQALAHELAKRGNTAEAIENYRTALKLDPQLLGLHFELAEMLRVLGTADSREEAAREYKAALEANPLDAQSESRLGDIAYRDNDLEAASVHYSRAVQLQPDNPEANIGLAKVLMSLGQPQKAEVLLQHVLQSDPTSAVAHFRLSTIYRQTGRTAEAKHEVEQYQKYSKMKDQLREVYRDLHREQPADENDDSDAHK